MACHRAARSANYREGLAAPGAGEARRCVPLRIQDPSWPPKAATRLHNTVNGSLRGRPSSVTSGLADAIPRTIRHMSAIALVLRLLVVVDQSYVGFIHQCGGLKTVFRPIPPQVMVRKPAQLRIRSASSHRARSVVPLAPGAEHLADVISHRAFRLL